MTVCAVPRRLACARIRRAGTRDAKHLCGRTRVLPPLSCLTVLFLLRYRLPTPTCLPTLPIQPLGGWHRAFNMATYFIRYRARGVSFPYHCHTAAYMTAVAYAADCATCAVRVRTPRCTHWFCPHLPTFMPSCLPSTYTFSPWWWWHSCTVDAYLPLAPALLVRATPANT